MKSKKIGKLIEQLRNENNLSQEDLANKINISLDHLKKIEKGQGEITTQIIWDLRNLFNVTVDELLNAYVDKKEINIHDKAKILSNNVKKKKKRKFITSLLITFLIFNICLIGIKLYQNRDWGYLLKGETENFTYDNAMFLHDNGVYYLTFGEFNFKNGNISKENIKDIRLKCNDRLIIASNTFLTGTTREQKGYDELFPKIVAKNVDDWYYEITYYINDEIIVERMNLINEPIK